MKRVLPFLLLLLLAAFSTHAQKVSGVVKGVLQDSLSASPLADATVSVVRSSDSTLISFTLTNSSGAFQVKNLDAGDYYIVASYTGLETLRKGFTVTADQQTHDFGTLKLDRSYKTLDEVVIEEAPVRIKGDTLSFRADAFKTKPNATVEDLLKRIPGVAVERDGTVRAQGENVQKVYVDGKEFFSNDPKLATKNLTADMVDRVEVFDDMSEQSRFNGIDDGSRSKAINLKLKKDKKKGLFGRAYAGAGSEERYDAGLTANYFKGAMQSSVIAKSNNTNNVGFSLNDMLGMFSGSMGRGGMMMGGDGGGSGGMGGGFGGGGMMMMMAGNRGGSNMSLGGSGRGITASSQAGLNYRDTWSKTFDINGSYFYNRASTENDRNSFRQTFAPDSTLLTANNTLSNSWNNNHRLNLNLITTIDSFNSLIYTPNVNLQQSRSFSDDTLSTSATGKFPAYRINESRTLNDNNGNGYTWTNNLIWRRKFRRAGRTLSVNFNNTLAENSRDGFSNIASRFFNNQGTPWLQRRNNFLIENDGRTDNYGLSLSYTEPVARDKVLEFNYRKNNNSSNARRSTRNFNPATAAYDVFVDSLSNFTETEARTDRLGANIRIVKKKYNYQVGFALQQATIEAANLTRKTLLVNDYRNYIATAGFNYQFARSKNLRLNYNGQTSAPSAQQLQEVPDLTNYPFITTGNSALKQEFTNMVTLSYTNFNMLTFRNLFAFLTYRGVSNRIANSIDQLPGGVQRSMPVNVNGVYMLSANVNVGFPIRSLKRANFNATTRGLWNNDVNVVNNVENRTRTMQLAEDLRFSYNYKEKLDLGFTASVNYYGVDNSVQKTANNSYYTHTYTGDISYNLSKGFILATDIDWEFNTGRTDGFNQNFARWNASLAKQVFKNKRGELKLAAYDILNQNTNVMRNVVNNYIEDVENSVLRRFFMVSFTYNLNRMGGRTIPPAMERGLRNIRM